MGGDNAYTKDAAHIYGEKSSSGMMQLLPLQLLNFMLRYNVLPTGEADKLTLHGACPVLFGTKWGKSIK